MKHKIWPLLRKGAVTVSVSAGCLAIANVETIWQEYHSRDHQETNRFVGTQAGSGKGKSPVKLAIPSEGQVAYKPLQSALSQSLEEDELQDGNPFAHLSTLEPLQKIMQKGVAHFHRETFRSPEYHEESGYDLLSYEIEHTDGSKSGVIAYLEKPEAETSTAVGGPDGKVVFVVFMVANGPNSSLSFYRGGDLVEQSELSTSEVQTLVSHRLSQGIPFLSVSR
ncbi:MAG: hypothetical protein ACXVA9_00820 [Bdellovibrionales bacterium]